MAKLPISQRWTSADLALLPDNGKRYEIIDGELYVSRQPHAYHQAVCTALTIALGEWSRATHSGLTIIAPGLVFAEDDDVVPDLVWISRERFATAVDESGHLREAPDLAIEVLSPGWTNEQRDREVKRKLYSRRGVLEYWIVDWRARRVDVFRRRESGLELLQSLNEADQLESPILPGFSLAVHEIFADVPQSAT